MKKQTSKKVLAELRRKPRVPTLVGQETVSFPNLSQYERPLVELNDCIPAPPVCVESEPFYLCGSQWKLLLFPFGCDEEGQWLGVRLRNLTSKPVDIAYTLSLHTLHPDPAPLHFLSEAECKPWETPSSFAGHAPRCDVFEPLGGCCEWGIDELVMLEELGPRLAGDGLAVAVYMEVFSEIDLEQHPLSRLIEGGGACSEGDLIDMADRDLVLLKRRGGGAATGQVERQQDTLVARRGEPAAATGGGGRGSGRTSVFHGGQGGK